MEPLANIAMLEARLARDVQGLEKARAEELLKDASSTVRSLTGQTISEATTSVRLVPDYRRGRYGVVLPQWPVTDVATVVDDAAANVDVTWAIGTDFIAVTVPVTITYTHGWNPVPDDIIALVCQIVGRAITTPVDNTGITSESLGSYSYTLGAAAASGPLGMLNDERSVLAKYRRPTRPISMIGCIPDYTLAGDWA